MPSAKDLDHVRSVTEAALNAKRALAAAEPLMNEEEVDIHTKAFQQIADGTLDGVQAICLWTRLAAIDDLRSKWVRQISRAESLDREFIASNTETDN